MGHSHCGNVALLLMHLTAVLGGTPGTHYVYSSISTSGGASQVSFNFVNNNPSHVDIDLISSPCSTSSSLGTPHVLYKTDHTIDEVCIAGSHSLTVSSQCCDILLQDSSWTAQSGVDGWSEQTSPSVSCTGIMYFYGNC